MKQIEREQKGREGSATDDEVGLSVTFVGLQLTHLQAKRH
jgi:hypothetical protein